jgi:hypothetical protein
MRQALTQELGAFDDNEAYDANFGSDVFVDGAVEALAPGWQL